MRPQARNGGNAERTRRLPVVRARRRSACGVVKYVAATDAVEVPQRLVDVVGGPAYARNQPFERMWRDVQAGPIMPMGNLAARRLIGADTLGAAVAPVS